MGRPDSTCEEHVNACLLPKLCEESGLKVKRHRWPTFPTVALQHAPQPELTDVSSTTCLMSQPHRGAIDGCHNQGQKPEMS